MDFYSVKKVFKSIWPQDCLLNSKVWSKREISWFVPNVPTQMRSLKIVQVFSSDLETLRVPMASLRIRIVPLRLKQIRQDVICTQRQQPQCLSCPHPVSFIRVWDSNFLTLQRELCTVLICLPLFRFLLSSCEQSAMCAAATCQVKYRRGMICSNMVVGWKRILQSYIAFFFWQNIQNVAQLMILS